MSFSIPALTTVQVAASSKFNYKTYAIRDNLTPPTFNTLHEIMNETGGVRLVSLSLYQHNDETNAKEVDIVITKDGVLWEYDSSAIDPLDDNLHYTAFVVPTAADPVRQLGITTSETPLLQGNSGDQGGKALEGHDIKVELRQTSALGTNQTIVYKLSYELLEAV